MISEERIEDIAEGNHARTSLGNYIITVDLIRQACAEQEKATILEIADWLDTVDIISNCGRLSDMVRARAGE